MYPPYYIYSQQQKCADLSMGAQDDLNITFSITFPASARRRATNGLPAIGHSMAYHWRTVGGPLIQCRIAGRPLVAHCCVLAGLSYLVKHVTNDSNFDSCTQL